MARRFLLLGLGGAALVTTLGAAGGTVRDDELAERLSEQADAALDKIGASKIEADFRTARGLPTRHPLLSRGESLDEGVRARAAKAVAAVPGVGGIRWADGSVAYEVAGMALKPLHCQEDVEALLQVRTIRFEEASSRIDRTSRELLDEVAAALRPCLGSIIAITGHTDSSGPEPGNLALSRARADAVLNDLRRRGIPADGLRARGVGSKEPVEGLDPTDPANRRIEFDVIETEPLFPTPIDTPGAR